MFMGSKGSAAVEADETRRHTMFSVVEWLFPVVTPRGSRPVSDRSANDGRRPTSRAPSRHTDADREELRARYRRVRDLTEALAAPLRPEDQVIQSMADVSPTKWHRGHTTWFFETFLLEPTLTGYDAFDPDFRYLFNSYYEAVGPRHPRSQRGLLSRPTVDECPVPPRMWTPRWRS